MKRSELFQVALALVVIVAVANAFFEEFSVFLSGILVVCTVGLIFTLSPTHIFIGKRSAWGDALVSLGFLLSGWYVIGDLLWSVNERAFLVWGILLLLLASIIIKYTVKPEKKGMYFVFKRGKLNANPIVLFLFMTGLFVAVYRQVLSRVLALGSSPWVVALVALFLLGVSLSLKGLFGQGLKRFAVRLVHPMRGFTHLFTRRGMVLLGLSGLLIAYFSFDTLYSLCKALPQILSVSGASLGAALLSAFGTVLLALIPLYIWWKVFNLRLTKHPSHLPDWNRVWLSITYAAIVSVLFFPVLSFSNTPFLWDILKIGAHPGISSASRVMLALGGAAVMLVFALIIGSLDKFLRRVLMVGPFFVSLFFVGMYIYAYFVTQFFTYMNIIVAWANGEHYLAAACFLLLFIIGALFFVTGFLSFAYEVARD